MYRITSYMVVKVVSRPTDTESISDLLASKVNKCLLEGWQPLGGPNFISSSLTMSMHGMQAMVLDTFPL